jgi:hypothetical protein
VSALPRYCEIYILYIEVKIRVADPDPVGSGPFWSDPDPDVWKRIRILALKNDLISTFFVSVKAINT